MTLDDLERRKRTIAEKIVLRSPPEKNDEAGHVLSAAKCRSMILVSRNMRYMLERIKCEMRKCELDDVCENV